MESFTTLKAKYPNFCLPEIEVFLKTQNEDTLKFVTFCLGELATLVDSKSATWICYTSQNLYSLVKVMRYLVGANAKINKIDDMNMYNVTFNWNKTIIAN